MTPPLLRCPELGCLASDSHQIHGSVSSDGIWDPPFPAGCLDGDRRSLDLAGGTRCPCCAKAGMVLSSGTGLDRVLASPCPLKMPGEALPVAGRGVWVRAELS